MIGLQEIRNGYVEIFEHVLQQRYPNRFRIAGSEEAASQMIYNSDTVTLGGRSD